MSKPATPEKKPTINIPALDKIVVPTEPKPEVKPPVVEPVIPPVAPIVDGADDGDDIPMDLIPSKERTGNQWKEERRAGKLAKAAKELGVDDLRRELDSHKTLYATTQAELDRYKGETAAEKKRADEYAASEAELKTEIEQQRNHYFEQHGPNLDPAEDEELRTASGAVNAALSAGMPAYLPDQDGTQKRSVFARVAGSDHGQKIIDEAMAGFAMAHQNGNDEQMTLAVNLMASAAGCTSIKFSRNPEEQELLGTDDQSFRDIESAMVRALPSWKGKQSRLQHLTERAPEVIRENLDKRQRDIAANIRKGVFLDAYTVASIAAVDPSDARVLINNILAVSPELADDVNRFIAAKSPALARMGAIRMPTLLSKDPKEIAAHRAEAARYQSDHAEMLQLAVAGYTAKQVVPALIQRLQDAEARAARVAVNENPGTYSPGNGRESGDDDGDGIPTEIIPSRRR